jgi:hypothetical protein
MIKYGNYYLLNIYKMFIDRFKSENGKIEYTAISSGGVKVIPEKFAHMSKTYNIYFLANVRNDLVY